MSKLGPGPRDYTAGTERALYAFSGTTCYFPDCTAPVIVFVGGEPVCNVQIAHVLTCDNLVRTGLAVDLVECGAEVAG
jgi:hypothetical protein